MGQFTCKKYHVVRRIGAGGIAEVWEGRHKVLQQKVALKVLQRHWSARQEVVKRFALEARVVATIDHPGIVKIHGVGLTSDKRAYIAMELCNGEPLSRRLKRQGQLAVEQSLTFMRQLARAMKAVHARNILHRDLKPDNLFIVKDDDVTGGERIKVLDFGMAKLVSELSAEQLTANGSVFGTPKYMAPEQYRSSSNVDAGADIYSIGCIFYHCLCGRPPFVFDNAVALMNAHLKHTPEPPERHRRDLPARLPPLLMALLEKSPRRRVQSCQQLLTRLARLSAPVARSWEDSSEATTLLNPSSLSVLTRRDHPATDAHHSLDANALTTSPVTASVDSQDAVPLLVADNNEQDTERIIVGHLHPALQAHSALHATHQPPAQPLTVSRTTDSQRSKWPESATTIQNGNQSMMMPDDGLPTLVAGDRISRAPSMNGRPWESPLNSDDAPISPPAPTSGSILLHAQESKLLRPSYSRLPSHDGSLLPPRQFARMPSAPVHNDDYVRPVYRQMAVRARWRRPLFIASGLLAVLIAIIMLLALTSFIMA